jgi:glycosyltransferase involved in cell wall biosynthesis
VYGYFLENKNQVVPELETLDAEVHCFKANKPLHILSKVRAVAQYARAVQANVIHAHLPLAGIVARLAGRLAGIPVVYTEHNLQERYHPLTRWANTLTLPWCDCVLGVSAEVTRSALRHVRKPIEAITLLNGVNTGSFDPMLFNRTAVRLQLGLPAEAPIMGTVAVFRQQKRLDDWLLLAEAVWQLLPEAHFVILGDGPCQAALQEQVRRQDMKKQVHFPGRLPDVRPWLAAMDVYVMTSAFEGLPIALLEAMSMTLPVAATAAGGIPEVVRDGKEGFLVPVGQAQRLLEPIVQLLQNPHVRTAMGKAARQRVEEAFSVKRMVRELEHIYEQVCNGALHE